MTQTEKPQIPRSVTTLARLADWAWYGGIVLAAIAVLVQVVALLPGTRPTLHQMMMLRTPATIRLPVDVRYDPVLMQVALSQPSFDAFALVGHSDVIIDAGDETAAGGVISIIWLLIAAAAILWVVKQLRLLIKSVRNGNPFDSQNPRRIRRIAFAVMASGPILGLLEFLRMIGAFNEVARLVKEVLPGARAGYEVDLHPETIVVGLIILAIAYAFEAGVRLQNDQNLTV